jgi:hypothetical protein
LINDEIDYMLLESIYKLLEAILKRNCMSKGISIIDLTGSRISGAERTLKVILSKDENYIVHNFKSAYELK